MITAERKPLDEILGYLKDHRRILLAGCNECVTVCHAGGRREVAVLASALELARSRAGEPLEIGQITLERQCDPEFVEELALEVDNYDALCSLACGCGAQSVAARFPQLPVYPMVNTTFMGSGERQGVWAERCAGCGECVLAFTGGICPVARCAKRIFNGPCGGSAGGRCEVDPEVDCGWQLIWDRLKSLGRTDLYRRLMPAKDWRPAGGGGPRRMVREDIF